MKRRGGERGAGGGSLRGLRREGREGGGFEGVASRESGLRGVLHR